MGEDQCAPDYGYPASEDNVDFDSIAMTVNGDYSAGEEEVIVHAEVRACISLYHYLLKKFVIGYHIIGVFITVFLKYNDSIVQIII